jgi:RNA polymerase sigma-70 factor (ECF subfamily)
MSSELELAAVYDAHASALYGFLLNLTRSESDTRDLLQEVFVRLARHPGLLQGAAHPRSFLFRLAHNLSIDWARRRASRERRHEQYSAEGDELLVKSPDPDREEFGRALGLALGELPTEQRAVVHLKLWEGMTFDAIGEALEISVNTAASRYRYGLDKLRERLRPLYDEIKPA